MSEMPPWGFNINIQPGDRVAFAGIDGILRTKKVSQISYTEAQPAQTIYPTGWKKLIRLVTPLRWRKPLPVKPPTGPTISFSSNDPFWEDDDV